MLYIDPPKRMESLHFKLTDIIHSYIISMQDHGESVC